MVKNQISKFVIPFSFVPKRYEELYASIQAHQVKVRSGKVPAWEVRHLRTGENEFFPFFKDSLDADNPQGVGTLWQPGSQWQFKGHLFYRSPGKEESTREYINCGLRLGGLALFKTGIGFVWFDITMTYWPNFPNKKDTQKPSMSQIIDINNFCKDICHRNLSQNQERFLFYPGRVYGEGDQPPAGAEPWQRFSIFQWLRENVFDALKDIEFFAPTYAGGEISPVQGSSAQTREGQERYKDEDRDRNEKDSARSRLIGPNKAHVFTYIHMNPPETSLEELQSLYWLRKGYRPSYLPSEQMLSFESREILQLFQNMTCGICYEGCAFFSYHTGQKQTDNVSESEFKRRMDNYFLLYLISLHQRYTLLYLSAQMARLPSSLDRFGGFEYQRLMGIQEDLGLAYTKAFFPQVSYVDHHNVLYSRFREILSIDRLQEDLSRRTAVLSDLIQNYRNRKIDRFGHILTVTGGIFALLQTISTLLGVYDMEPRLASLGRWGFAGLTLLVSLLLGITLTALWHSSDNGKHGRH